MFCDDGVHDPPAATWTVAATCAASCCTFFGEWCWDVKFDKLDKFEVDRGNDGAAKNGLKAAVKFAAIGG